MLAPMDFSSSIRSFLSSSDGIIVMRCFFTRSFRVSSVMSMPFISIKKDMIEATLF